MNLLLFNKGHVEHKSKYDEKIDFGEMDQMRRSSFI